jgi:trk system potassium uptake protein TrkA
MTINSKKGNKKMKKSFAVIGLGKFGCSVAIELAKAGCEVLAIDIEKDRVHAVADLVTCAVRADVRDTETMKTFGISNMDAVVVAITGSLDSSIIASIFAKDMGVPCVIAKSKGNTHTKILEKVGVDQIIIPEHESGVRVARNLATGDVLNFIELSDFIRMIEIQPKKEWLEHSLREIDLRKKYKTNVIAIRKDGKLNMDIDPDEVLHEDMSLLVTIHKNDLKKLL